MSHRPARFIARLAARLLPSRLRSWGLAMEAEAGSIDGRLAALGFALGCLGCALRERLRFNLPRPTGAGPTGDETMLDVLTGRPRRVGMLCAAGATGLGLAWMAAAGAPPRYLAVNGIALLLGLLALAVLGRVGDVRRGIADLMLSTLLLLTAFWGLSADGVARWVAVGGVLLQPSLVLLPILALRFARSRDSLSTLAILLAALALALQPDRAMAGALAAAMAALSLLRPGRHVLVALAAAGTAFAVTIVRPDASPAVPFVDQLFFSAFAIHALAGLAVAAGAALLLVPAALAFFGDAGDRPAYATFGALWFAVILAALIGNYPTPVVGYGGSAILGYLFSLIGLPSCADRAAAGGEGVAGQCETENRGDRLQAGLMAST